MSKPPADPAVDHLSWAEWEIDEGTHQRLGGTKGFCGKAGRAY